MVNAVFSHAQQEIPNVATFWFRPERHLAYTAGQYTELTIMHDHPDDRGAKRWFTLSSAPGSELVSITTKYAGDSKSSSFKNALFDLQPGQKVALTEPMGDFVLPKDPSIPLIFVAGGIGITPFHSMLEWLSAHQERRVVTILYCVAREGDIIFRPTLALAGVEPLVVVSNASPSWQGERGRLDISEALRLAKRSPGALIYMSGPEAMVETLEKAMLAGGISKTRLVTDLFSGYND